MHQKSLGAHLAVSLANRLAPATSTLATPITPKLIFINFKKVQGKDHIKVFQSKIKATIKQLTSLIKLFNQFSDCVDVRKFYQLKHFLDRLLNFQDHLSEQVRTISSDQWQHLDFNFYQFSKILFTSLYRCYPNVLKEEVLVLDNTALDWL
jgi:hypothetical protein